MKRVRRMVLMLVVLVMGVIINKRNVYAASVTASNYSELKKHLNSTTKDTVTITKDIEITGIRRSLERITGFIEERVLQQGDCLMCKRMSR